MYQHLLVPIDETELGAELVSDAIDFARSLGAKVTFLNVKRSDEASLYGDAAILHAMAPEQFLQTYRWAARSVLARAEAGARALGVEHRVVSAPAHGPLHEVILRTAHEHGCDLIVMASHERQSRLVTLMASNAVAVMTRTDIPFLLAIPGKSGPTSMRRAITRIRDEHRTIAAVMDGLLKLLSQASAPSLTAEEQRIAQASLRFLAEFAGKQHHPKEEDYLFAKLESCGDEQVTESLRQLRHQHHGEYALVQAAERAVAGARDGLRSAVEALARHVYGHMSQEEASILPIARRRLSSAEWEELQAAFDGHTDPRFSTDTEDDRRAMYARLVNELPPARS